MEKKIEMYSEEELYEANCRIAAYNRAEQEFEADVDFLLFLLLGKRKRRMAHAMFTHRNVEGAQEVLIDRYLMDDDTKFREYFRLTPHLFSTVLALIKEDLDGIPTSWIRKPITAHEKLCITLR